MNTPAYGQVFATAATFADLRTIPTSQIEHGYWALIAGGLTSGDGLGGLMVWNSTATTPDDDETVIIPDDNPPVGRWLRVALGKVATAQTFINSTVAAPNPENGWSQLTREFTTPNRPDGNPGALKFREAITYGPYQALALYPDQPKFEDNVWGVGWNITQSFTPLDTTQGSPTIRIESKFPKASRNPAKTSMFGAEQHIAMHTCGENAQEFRSISIWQPHLTEDWKYDSDLSFQGAVYAFSDGNYVSGSPNTLMSFNWTGPANGIKTIDLRENVYFTHASNNTAVMRQFNATKNAMLPLPFINNGNHLQIGQPIYGTFNIPGDNALGIKSLLTLIATAGAANGARLIYVNSNPITGSATGLDFNDTSCSTRFEGVRVRNTHASGTSGMRIHGNGATYLDFFNEANFHRWGLRLKTNGDFTIGQSVQGADISDALRINFTTLQTKFMKPSVLAVNTVAGHGAAISVQGSTAYVTDLTSTTLGSIAVGGGTNSGVIVSDGTNWRIMTAW